MAKYSFVMTPTTYSSLPFTYYLFATPTEHVISRHIL